MKTVGKRLWLTAILGGITGAACIAGLFALAGRLDWIEGWAYLALVAAGGAVNSLVVRRRDPELLRRRRTLGEGTPAWDKAWLGGFGLLLLAIPVVAALDAGRHGPSLPRGLWAAGLAVLALSVAGLTWAMSVNTHFEKSVRIQTDRDHRVVDDGPYRLVRHPGYVASLGLVLASPLLLLSAWALAPAGACVLWLALRTVLEDRKLRRELDGYDEYARRVRWKWVPGVW